MTLLLVLTIENIAGLTEGSGHTMGNVFKFKSLASANMAHFCFSGCKVLEFLIVLRS